MGWLGSLLKIGEKLTTYIPGKIEGLKNELDRLETERSRLYVTKCDVKEARRLCAINSRIDVINGLLKNKACD